MTGEKPQKWSLWILLTELQYNSNWHSVIGVPPYEVVYGQPPSLHIPYVARDSAVEAVDKSLKVREERIEMLKYRLNRAEQKMKKQADKHRNNRQFEIGAWLYVKLQLYRQHSIALRRNQKLGQDFLDLSL